MQCNACCPVALSTLRNCEGSAPAVQHRSVADVEELAASYERKLIEVSVFHKMILNSTFIIAFLDDILLIWPSLYSSVNDHMHFGLKW